MDKYECPCGYVYDPAEGDPDNGIAPGTAWEDVPRIGYAPPADWARMHSPRLNKTNKRLPRFCGAAVSFILYSFFSFSMASRNTTNF